MAPNKGVLNLLTSSKLWRITLFSKLSDWLLTSILQILKSILKKKILATSESQLLTGGSCLLTFLPSYEIASQIQFLTVTYMNSPCPQLCREPKWSRCIRVSIICRATQLLGHQPQAGIRTCSESFFCSGSSSFKCLVDSDGWLREGSLSLCLQCAPQRGPVEPEGVTNTFWAGVGPARKSRAPPTACASFFYTSQLPL